MSDALELDQLPKSGDPAEQLSRLFGSYKAEWLSEQLFDLFTEPRYWPELTDDRPCLLVGGRGTGKTTVLRVLSYEGQYALRGRSPSAVKNMEFIGFYTRVDTNRVRAFDGPELAETDWIRVFAHYLNLSMVRQVLRFTEWYDRHIGAADLIDPTTCEQVAASLSLDRVETAIDLRVAVDRALIDLEVAVNNVGDQTPRGLSMQKAPVDRLMTAVNGALPGKRFFFVFDEYENYAEYQQRVVNTLVKHAGGAYTFKIGVRELGFKSKSTLNPDEQLISPADYVKLSISEKLHGEDFREFARSVCNSRLERMGSPEERLVRDIAALLPGLTEEQEAEALGARDICKKEARAAGLEADVLVSFLEAPLVDQLVVVKWPAPNGDGRRGLIEQYVQDPSLWRDRVNNYGYAFLFTLRRGRGQRGIQKYYAGWDTFSALAAGNIRYVLELVEQTLLRHIREGHDITEVVHPADQTLAAQGVGRKNLSELEGLSVHGAKLTKLVLGLGRVFQLFAVDPVGHTPEINEFELADPGLQGTDSSTELDELLTSAVMHLALLRRPGSKVSTEPTDTRDFDYRLHPVFSPFFVFSHRHKRKMTLSDADLLGLVRAPRQTIPSIMARNNRAGVDPLPEQLKLFRTYFGVDASPASSD